MKIRSMFEFAVTLALYFTKLFTLPPDANQHMSDIRAAELAQIYAIFEGKKGIIGYRVIFCGTNMDRPKTEQQQNDQATPHFYKSIFHTPHYSIFQVTIKINMQI